MEEKKENLTDSKAMELNAVLADSVCDHYYVPIGDYEQNGRFICTKCKDEI